jgi:hypothetical protein
MIAASDTSGSKGVQSRPRHRRFIQRLWRSRVCIAVRRDKTLEQARVLALGATHAHRFVLSMRLENQADVK